MANSFLIFYEPIENFGEESDYWRAYVDFYEKYWGGPTSPLGVWFGTEYLTFRTALSSYLGIEEEDINDCYFMKGEDNRYFVSPLKPGEGLHLIRSADYIPLHWFLLFVESERKALYTHWGFSAIHYDTGIELSINRLKDAISTITIVLEGRGEIRLLPALFERMKLISQGMDDLKMLLSGFDPSGYLVLNYGEICNFIHPYTIKNENSVGEVWQVLSLLRQGRLKEADSQLNILYQKWDEIRGKASGKLDKFTLQ